MASAAQGGAGGNRQAQNPAGRPWFCCGTLDRPPIQVEVAEVPRLWSHTGPMHQSSCGGPSPPSRERSWREVTFAPVGPQGLRNGSLAIFQKSARPGSGSDPDIDIDASSADSSPARPGGRGVPRLRLGTGPPDRPSAGAARPSASQSRPSSRNSDSELNCSENGVLTVDSVVTDRATCHHHGK